MSIFIIQKSQAKPLEEQVKENAAKGVQNVEQTTEVASQQKEAKSEPEVVSIVPSSTSENTSSGEGGEQTQEDKEKKIVQVSINGPVGQAFTEALNKLLVTESYMTMMPALKEERGGSIAGNSSLQVYCWDGDDIDLQDLTQLTNTITKHNDQQFVIAVENIRTVRKIHTLIDQLPVYGNVTVCYSREKALRVVQEKIKQ